MNHKAIYGDIGVRLRKVRESMQPKKISQEQFGKKFNVSQGYVTKVEKGGKPSLEYILNIARECHISLDWLLLGRSPVQDRQPSNSLGVVAEEQELYTVHGCQPAMPVQIQAALTQDDAFAAWIAILLKLSPDARALLLNINRTHLENTFAATNPQTDDNDNK